MALPVSLGRRLEALAAVLALVVLVATLAARAGLPGAAAGVALALLGGTLHGALTPGDTGATTSDGGAP